eukprot:Gb_32521 [translate_table: standard]
MEFPECSICLQPYDEKEQSPRVLWCGHSLCQTCINELPRHWKDSATRDCLIRCPECNQWVKLPLQGPYGLPKNIELLRLIQTLTKPENVKPKRRPAPPAQTIEEELFIKKALVDGKAPVNFNNFLSLQAPTTDWTNWVIPQDAILMTEYEEEQPELIVGRMVVACKEERVSLMRLDTPQSSLSASGLDGAGPRPYTEHILKLLQTLSETEKTELQVLMRHSLVNRRVCRLYGFWMNSEGLVFLVSEKSENNVSQIWGTLKSGSIYTALKNSSIQSSSMDELRRWQLSGAMRSFARAGMEICEVVMRLHSQALMCGHLAPECFDFDEFGHPLIDLSNALLTRKRLKQVMKYCVVGTGSCQAENLQNPITMPWLYLSPEVLSILYKNGRETILTDAEIRKCALGSVSEMTTPISFKADVWSLGCLLLMLFFGESPLSDLSFSDFSDAVVMKSIKIEVWLEERIALFSRMKECFGSQVEHFQHLLCKCFEYEPSSRPDAVDLWRCLNGWFLSAEQLCKGTVCISQHEKGCWCLVLGESLSPLTRGVESHADQEEANGKSGTKHKLENKFKNAGSSDMIDPQGAGGSVVGNKEGNELQMHELKVVTLEGHLDCVTGLAVCGEFLLSASYDKTICIWSLQNHSLLQTLRGHEHRVLALAIDVKASLCFSGDHGGCICVWAIGSVPKQESVMTWYEHRDWRYSGVHSLVVSEDGYLYSGSGDKTIKAWSLQVIFKALVQTF